MKSIGIDIGTTTVSAVVMDLEQKNIATSRTISNGGFLQGEVWESIQDPAMLVDKAKTLVDELLMEYDDVIGIGLTGQMHGIVYIDGDGRAVSPLYTWQDQSAQQPLADGKSVVDVIKEKYHLPVATGFGCMTCLHHVKTGQVPPDARQICTIADYLGMVLTGRKTPLLHASNAAGLSLYNVETFAFLPEVFQAEGGDPSMLPQSSTAVEELGKYKGIPVYCALGDNQAAFLGSIGYRENVWSLNIGTSSQICVLSKQYFETPGIDVRPYMDGTYLLTGAGLCGGRAYAILERFFRSYAKALGLPDEAQYDVMAGLLPPEEEGSGGLQVRTTFAGTRQDPSLRGSITNISDQNLTPGNLIRGVLQGIVDEMAGFHDLICAGTDIRVDGLVASGNACRMNPELRRLLSETFGAELTQAAFTEEAASGAALSAAGKKEPTN